MNFISRSLLIAAATMLASQAQTTNPAADPAKPASSYLIAKNSASPDGRYAIAYPKGSEDDSVQSKNYLVALKPFRVLAVLAGDGLSAESQRLSLEAAWTADSSELIATTKHDKWDMIVGSALVVLRDGQVAQNIDLLEAINGQMAADFRKSKAEVYNEFLPFILVDSKIGFADGGKTVRVGTAACNDPNEARAIEWTANFSGTWDVAGAKWLTGKVASKSKKNPLAEE